jgi:putative salt-induced outer membrane protein
MSKIKKITMLSLLLSSNLIIADEVKLDSEKNIFNYVSTKTTLGYMESSGNSDISTGTLLFDILKKIDNQEFKLNYEWLYSEENSNINKDKMTINGEYVYNYRGNKNIYMNYLLTGEIDKFSGYDYKIFTGPGLYIKVINTKTQLLSIGSNILIEGDKQEYIDIDIFTSLLFKEIYEQKINNSLLTLKQDLSFRDDLTNFENFNVIFNIGLESKLNKHFAIGINLKVDYNELVPFGVEQLDKVFTSSLIINN